MNKIIRLIQNYLIIALPFVIACMVWETLYPTIEFEKDISLFTKLLWEGLSFNLILWFAMLILFLLSIVIVPGIREKTLRRLANLKERDEREQYITGKASRAAYLSTLSVMILFLFFSMFSLRLTTIPKNPATGTKHSLRAGIGLHISLLNNQETTDRNSEGNVLFDSRDISLSSSATIFLLLTWQLLIFNYTARKEQMKDLE